MNKIEIPLNKTKLLFGIGGSILFVVIGLYILTTMADQQTRINPTMVKGVVIAGILFFGATGIYGIKKMFDKTIGLTIDEKGIFDNTNASSVGLIKWTDITEIKTEQVASTKFLLIYTTNPDFYLDKVKGFKKKLMEGNNKMYGTPLSITSNTLKYNFDDLEKLINDRLNEQRKTRGAAMADEWHVSVDGAQRGPLTSEQVRSLVSSGQLKPTDHIWKDGMTEWVAAFSVRGLFPQQQPVPQRKAGPPPLSPFPVVTQGAAAQSVSPRASPATFSEAATRGFSRLFDFSGRSSRSEFWWFYLLLVLIWLPVFFMAVNAGVRVEAMQLLGYIYWAVLLSGVGARRLHDTNHSGWWQLLIHTNHFTGWWQLLILTGIGGLVLLVLWCQKGTPSQNRFG